MSDDELFREYAHEVLLRHRAKRKAASRERRMSVAASATEPSLRDSVASSVGSTPALAQRDTNESRREDDTDVQETDTDSSLDTNTSRSRKRRRGKASQKKKPSLSSRLQRGTTRSAGTPSARSTPTTLRTLPMRTYGRKANRGADDGAEEEEERSKRLGPFSMKESGGEAKQDGAEVEREDSADGDGSDNADNGDNGDVYHHEGSDDNEDPVEEADYYGPELTEDGRDRHIRHDEDHLVDEEMSHHAQPGDYNNGNAKLPVDGEKGYYYMEEEYQRWWNSVEEYDRQTDESENDTEQPQGHRRGPRRSCRGPGHDAAVRPERRGEQDGEGEENSSDGSDKGTNDNEEDGEVQNIGDAGDEEGEDDTPDDDNHLEGASLEDARHDMDAPKAILVNILDDTINNEEEVGGGGGRDEANVGDSVEELLLDTANAVDLSELDDTNTFQADDTTGATNNTSAATATIVDRALRALELPAEIVAPVSDLSTNAPLGIRNALNAPTKLDVEFNNTHKGILHRLLKPHSAPGELRRMWPALRPIVWERVKALKRLCRPANGANVTAFNRVGPQLYGHSPPVRRTTPCSACTRAKSACLSLGGLHECARCLLSRAPCVEKRPATEGNV